MKRFMLFFAAGLVGATVLAGCRDGGGEQQAGGGSTATVGLPDDMKLKTLWDLKIKEGRAVKAWIKEGYFMVAAEGPNLLYLLRKQDGMNLWNCEFRKPMELSYPPAVSKDAIMAVTDGRIVRIHRNFGQIICLLDPEIPVSARPILETWVETKQGDPVIFAPSYGDGRVWALKIRKIFREMENPVPGEKPIRFPIYGVSTGWNRGAPRAGGHVLAPLTKVGSFIYVCTTNGYVMPLRLHDGSYAWPPLHVQGVVESGMSFSGDYTYFGCSDFKLYCLDRLTGVKRWELPTGSVVSARPLPDHGAGMVYCLAQAQGMIGVNDADGKRMWTNPQVRELLGVGEEAVYVLARDGSLLAINKKDGKAIWRSSLRGFRRVFPNEEQFERAGMPLYLPAITGGNELVCLVEKNFKPAPIREGEEDAGAAGETRRIGPAPEAGGAKN
jgi:hypothetical protein